MGSLTTITWANLFKDVCRILLITAAMDTDNELSGPLGLWNFPLLTTIIEVSNSSQGSSKIVENAKVIRDSNGEIQEIVVIKE